MVWIIVIVPVPSITASSTTLRNGKHQPLGVINPDSDDTQNKRPINEWAEKDTPSHPGVILPCLSEFNVQPRFKRRSSPGRSYILARNIDAKPIAKHAFLSFCVLLPQCNVASQPCDSPVAQVRTNLVS